MKNIINYLLPESTDSQNVHDRISKDFNFVRYEIKKTKRTIYDTFDWRLFKANLLLENENNEYSLYSFVNEEIIDSPYSNLKHGLKFWWDFSESSLRSILKSYLSFRALIPYFISENKIESYRILNEDDKTVVFLQFENVIINKGELQKSFNLIKVKSVKGYKTELFNVLSVIKEFKCDQLSLKAIYNKFHCSIGNTPGSYTSKFNLKLNPKQNTLEASQKIFKYLLNIMKQNEQGILNDIDTEFLHDFRVSIRRTRSALSQIKGIFPKDDLERIKKDFSALGKLSNRLRDLDVYLQNKEKYKSLILLELSGGLDTMFMNLKRERKREHTKFIKALQSGQCKNIIRKWENYLNSEIKANDTDELKNAYAPVKIAAKKVISKKYKYIKKIGKSIANHASDEVLHTLRIECKKLRYLLEFFSSLFPVNKINLFIKYLKKLQDNLGDFNDYYVQQSDLRNYLENKVKLNEDTIKTSSAIGSLITVLHREQKKVRSEFSKTFGEFNSKQNEKLFNEIFND